MSDLSSSSTVNDVVITSVETATCATATATSATATSATATATTTSTDTISPSATSSSATSSTVHTKYPTSIIEWDRSMSQPSFHVLLSSLSSLHSCLYCLLRISNVRQESIYTWTTEMIQQYLKDLYEKHQIHTENQFLFQTGQ